MLSRTFYFGDLRIGPVTLRKIFTQSCVFWLKLGINTQYFMSIDWDVSLSLSVENRKLELNSEVLFTFFFVQIRLDSSERVKSNITNTYGMSSIVIVVQIVLNDGLKLGYWKSNALLLSAPEKRKWYATQPWEALSGAASDNWTKYQAAINPHVQRHLNLCAYIMLKGETAAWLVINVTSSIDEYL